MLKRNTSASDWAWRNRL